MRVYNLLRLKIIEMNHIEYELIDISFEPLVEEGGGMASEARQVAVDKPKSGNKNQAKLTQMLLMSYNCPEIGMIKLTVGVRRRTSDKVQYGITALREGETIKPSKTKKASHKK